MSQPTLLEQIKGYLKITWNDEDTEIQSIIQRGQNYLNDVTCVELDFNAEAQPKSLLFDYCRYAQNNALEYFEANFQTEILRLQLKVGISTLEVEDE